jgi:hypothetical protein
MVKIAQIAQGTITERRGLTALKAETGISIGPAAFDLGRKLGA